MIFHLIESLRSEFDIIKSEISYGDFTVFPEEILVVIFSSLNPKTLCNLCQTSKTMNRLASRNEAKKFFLVISEISSFGIFPGIMIGRTCIMKLVMFPDFLRRSCFYEKVCIEIKKTNFLVN